MSDPKSREDDGRDEIFGLDLESEPIFRPASSVFTLMEMPAGKGKTVKFVIGSIVHRAFLKNTPPPSSKGEGQT